MQLPLPGIDVPPLPVVFLRERVECPSCGRMTRKVRAKFCSDCCHHPRRKDRGGWCAECRTETTTGLTHWAG